MRNEDEDRAGVVVLYVVIANVMLFVAVVSWALASW